MGQTAYTRWPLPGHADAHWWSRPYGETLEDLEVDLQGTAPFVTTDILCGCLCTDDKPLTRDEVWSWTVNRRLQGLLAVTLATRGELLILTAHCQQQACSQPMDLPLRIRDFLQSDDPLQVDVQSEGDQAVEIRLPTGNDQRAWLQEGHFSPDQMLERLIREPLNTTLSAEWFENIEAALMVADPLTILEIETLCPECGATNHLPVDLEHECLNSLAAEQPRLFDEIHQLASAYHWSEAEILAIPVERRRHYLRRVMEAWQ
ncbi:MAG: hypothetical protein ABW170_10125 [Candidatus Thiodiazotropha sp. L084R]